MLVSVCVYIQYMCVRVWCEWHSCHQVRGHHLSFYILSCPVVCLLCNADSKQQTQDNRGKLVTVYLSATYCQTYITYLPGPPHHKYTHTHTRPRAADVPPHARSTKRNVLVWMLSWQLNCDGKEQTCHQPVVAQGRLSDRKAAGGAAEIMCRLLSVAMYCR